MCVLVILDKILYKEVKTIFYIYEISQLLLKCQTARYLDFLFKKKARHKQQ